MERVKLEYKSIEKCARQVIDKILKNCQVFTQADEISEAFNTHFASVGKALAGDLPTPTISYSSYLINDKNLPAFDFLEISNEITESVINRSSERKATGYDGIPAL